MAAPASLKRRIVPPRTPQQDGTRYPAMLQDLNGHVTSHTKFFARHIPELQDAITDQNGQLFGGVTNAVDLATRQNPYEAVAAIAPHIGDIHSQPAAVSYDGPLNFTAPVVGINSTYFYARWTGFVTIPASGTWNFALKCTDGGNLFVNQTQIVGALTTNGAVNSNGNIALNAGAVPIVCEWQVGTDAPSLQVLWTPPAGSQALIPASAMSKSLNQVTGFLLGYWWNGSAAFWHP